MRPATTTVEGNLHPLAIVSLLGKLNIVGLAWMSVQTE